MRREDEQDSDQAEGELAAGACRDDLKPIYAATAAWKSARASGFSTALLRAAWLYSVAQHPKVRLIHILLALEAERAVNEKTGIFFTRRERLLAPVVQRLTGQRMRPWERDDKGKVIKDADGKPTKKAAPRGRTADEAHREAVNRLGELRHRDWGLLAYSDHDKQRPTDLCRHGGVGSVFALQAPGGDWVALVEKYRGKSEAGAYE